MDILRLQDFTDSQAKFAANHIILPYKLPQKLSKESQELSRESIFFSLCLKAIKGIKETYGDIYSIENFNEIYRMVDVWSNVQTQTLNSATIFKYLCCMPEDTIFPVYLKSQNSCIFINKYKEGSDIKASISGFQVSAKCEDVMKKSTDLYVTYPEVSWYIENYQMFFSQAITSSIEYLGNHELNNSGYSSSKKGVGQIEIREVKNHCYVSEWLCGLANEGGQHCEKVCFINKKLKDSIMWDNTLLPFRRDSLWISLKVVIAIYFTQKFGDQGKLLYKLFQCEILFLLCTISSKLKPEIKLQAIQKLARKMYKFSNLSEKLKLVQPCFNRYEDIIKSVKSELQSSVGTIFHGSRNKNARFDYERLNINDTIHKNSYIAQSILSFGNHDTKAQEILKSKYDDFYKFLDESKFPAFDYSLYRGNKTILPFELYDTETWIRNNLADFLKTIS